MEEIWKDIKEYEGLYQVSNLGRVRSFTKNTGEIRKIPLIMKANTSNPKNYPKVGLAKDKKVKYKRVHQLVAEAFIPRIEGKNIINHIDHDKSNNNFMNLEWCTQYENNQKMLDFYDKHKKPKVYKTKETRKKPDRTLYRKVERPSSEDLYEMIKNKSFTSIAKEYGVRQTSIRKWCIQYGIPSTKRELMSLENNS